MKQAIALTLVIVTLISCHSSPTQEEQMQLQGTWELISGTTIEKSDTVNTDYTRDRHMIKIINATHFAFLLHDLSKGKDSVIYSSGGGRYTLVNDQYTEHLDYCSDRQWENHTFQFTVSLKNDTLVQTGIEKLEDAGINRLNIEKYKRVKN